MKLKSQHMARPVVPLRTRARRRRESVNARIPVNHLTLPCHITEKAEARGNETIAAFLARVGWGKRRAGKAWGWDFALPTICVINGKSVLRKAWRRVKIKVGDVVEFWSRPWGGGNSGTGKQILGLVAVIALAAFAPWAGAAAFGAGTFGAYALTAAIAIGGSLLINALCNPKTATDDSSYDVDQIYSIAASGNAARLLQPLPDHYGRVKSFPDFATTPWSEFEGNDQYLNILLSQGVGKYEYENLFIDDTILWDPVNGISTTFTGVTVEFYDPREEVTLFPTNVTQASEVSGQSITSAYIGGFIANAAGSTANAIAVDLVWPSGCFTIDDSGNLGTSNVTVVVEARPVNDAGSPTGSYSQIAAQAYSFATRNPQRQTIKTAVSPGRWEVRVKRTDEPLSGTAGSNEVAWAGLRAFIDGASSFPVSTVAIRIKANSQLTESSSRKFGTLATRILPVWDNDTETWVEQATRNPFWAVWNAATNGEYGAGRPVSKVDFQTLYTMALAADARGDKFDYRFTSFVKVPDAIDTILIVARCRHRWSGDVLTFVRDEWSETPRMVLTDREIIRGSLSIEYALNTDDSADSVIIEYLDEGTWAPADVQYPPNSLEFTSVNPSRRRINGIVNRDHTYREAGFYYLQSQLRRINVSLDTEHDGRLLSFGSRVIVQAELPESWGYTGAVTARATNTLTLDPAPTWGSGTHYIRIRTKTGGRFGPVICTQGATANKAVLNNTDLASVESSQSMTLADALERGDAAEEPSFDFGVGGNRARHCVILSGSPKDDNVSLTLAVDVEAVHDSDLGDTPILPALPALRTPTAPTIQYLVANFHQGIAEPTLDVSWFPATGALYYRADVSYDNGLSWVQVYEGAASAFSQVVDRAALRVRVQGVGQRYGAFATADVDAPVITIAAGTVVPDSLVESLRHRIETTLDEVSARRDELEVLVSSIVANQDARNWVDNTNRRSDISARYQDAYAFITTVQQVSVDADAALALQTTMLGTELGNLSGTVTTQGASLTTLDSTINTLSSSVDARFAGTASTALSASVEQNATAIATATEAIASLELEIESISIDTVAGGYMRFVTTTAPTGAVASVAIEVNVGTPEDPTWSRAGIYMDAVL